MIGVHAHAIAYALTIAALAGFVAALTLVLIAAADSTRKGKR